MMNEFNRLANDIKGYSKKRGENAVKSASASIGIIEQLNPLIISTNSGEITYEEEEKEIILTKTFCEVTKNKGDEVIVVPLGSTGAIAVIDIIRR